MSYAVCKLLTRFSYYFQRLIEKVITPFSEDNGRRRQYTATSSLRFLSSLFVKLSVVSSSDVVYLIGLLMLVCLANLFGVGAYDPGVGGAIRLAGVVPRLQIDIYVKNISYMKT